jgi:Neutral/alkaline non-lysosomal ceramidase, N-terminal
VQAGPNLLAGTGRRCINPPPNIAHGGWGAQKHEQAEGIDLDLWVTALALSDGGTTVIVLDLDIQILTNQRADEIRQAVSKATGVPVQNIRACATHTHSGPVPYQSWIEKGFEMVGPWFEKVARWSAEAATEALAALKLVEVRIGRGECFINANRRCVTLTGERFLGVNPDGPSDHQVLVLRFDTAEGQPIATVVNYACHGTVMGPLNRLITPDYPGVTKRVVEQAIGGHCVFLQGSSGNQGPVQGFQADTRVYRQLGAVLGHEAARVALELRSLPSANTFREVVPSGAPLGMYDAVFAPSHSLPLQVLDREIQVPLRKGLPERREAAEKLDRWKARLKAARAEDNEAGITEAIYMARRADIQLRMADDFGGKTSTGVRTHFIRFGDVALVGCNIEPFCEIGLAIKQKSPFPATTLSGYTNGRLAYMPTAEEWSKGGYEVENSPFGQEAAEVLEREILETLNSLPARI